jgi:hypothetical protein
MAEMAGMSGSAFIPREPLSTETRTISTNNPKFNDPAYMQGDLPF